MTTKLYIKDRFITSLEELKQFVEEVGDSPSAPIAKQLIAAACDGVLGRWLKDASNEKEQQLTLSQEQLAQLRDSDRWKLIRKLFAGKFDNSRWDWKEKIELAKVPDNKFWDVLENGETAYLTFSFHCKEVMDEEIMLTLKGEGFYRKGQDFDIPDQYFCAKKFLDMNRPVQEVTFEVDGKGKFLEFFIGDDSVPIWRYEERQGEVYTVKGVSFTMIPVEGGRLQLGEGSNRYDVEVGSFSIGETVVTQDLWKVIMDGNPSIFKRGCHPVENVSWYDCQKFIERLNKETGKKFRLLTQHEWMFAAHGGNKRKHYKYCGSNNVNDVAWYRDNSGEHTHPVKEDGKIPNELGLFGMSGNVWEWTQNEYEGVSFRSSFGESWRSSFGGSWRDEAYWCSCELGFARYLHEHDSNLGFRLAT